MHKYDVLHRINLGSPSFWNWAGGGHDRCEGNAQHVCHSHFYPSLSFESVQASTVGRHENGRMIPRNSVCHDHSVPGDFNRA
jgi:hypothetical protein